MIEVIPAIDLMEGKCVRLLQGNFSNRTVYSDNPIETAKKFEQLGFRRLHLVDLDGAKSGKPVHLNVLEQIAKQTKLLIDFGGGVKTESDFQNILNAGAAQVTLGSIAVVEKEKVFGWIERYGGNKILLGADVYAEKIAINGWRTRTELDVRVFLEEFHAKGLEEAFVTDISKDGMMSGVSILLYKKILSHLPKLKLIASGGVSCLEDIVSLEEIGCKGVIVGKALYEGKLEVLKCLQKE
jgi:phosphoribosylformimino-5-aminoimidazole carboxamide ribotide isomerase